MTAHRFRTTRPIGPPGHVLTIDGPEAAHGLRAKRLRPGEAVEVLDGAGTVASARVHRLDPRNGTVDLHVEHVSAVPPPSPTIHVCTAVPKGPRVDELIAGLTQVGAASWRPVRCAHARDAGTNVRAPRLERIAAEAAKQCGRAWDLQLLPPIDFASAVSGSPVLIAHRDAPPAEACAHDRATLLIGPEGGWTEDELRIARDAGARLVSFGPHTMRVETAAIVGTAILMHLPGVHTP